MTLQFNTKVETMYGEPVLLTLDPRGGIQFIDEEGESQVWVTDCESMNEIWDSVVKMIMEKRNMSLEDAKETFEAITVDFAFCGIPVEEYDEELTPDNFTKKVTKAEYVKDFYENCIEFYIDLPEYQ